MNFISDLESEMTQENLLRFCVFSHTFIRVLGCEQHTYKLWPMEAGEEFTVRIEGTEAPSATVFALGQMSPRATKCKESIRD